MYTRLYDVECYYCNGNMKIHILILTAGLISNQILQNDSATVDKVLVTVKWSDGRTVQKEIKMKCPNLSQKFTISIRKKHLM